MQAQTQVPARPSAPHVSHSLFSPDYAAARLRFRQAATRLGWTLEAHSIGLTGPHGEDLTVDVAWSENGNADRTLVISSGVHGVEGFFGSAVQLAMLEQRAALGSLSVRCVFLHGLNLYGFPWLRRFDENNIDLNRNFLLEGEQCPGAHREDHNRQDPANACDTGSKPTKG